ncbi:MAG: Na(+)/H(+) antiporter subunit G [candidate division WS2 bacterium]|nr:Na(+)/H(+) antiporter subunit G [Candidatus Lithacetigena glycinireducens]MBT9174630.1 Na(+)/H(+) antiporter subunit G [Candidatus Lithacetigena glycinireducens]
MLSDILIIWGVIAHIIGCIGLLRFFDLYTKIHSASIISSMGIFFIMASIIVKNGFNEFGLKSLLIILLMLLFSPVTSHILANFSYRYVVKPKGLVFDDLTDDTDQESDNNSSDNFKG